MKKTSVILFCLLMVSSICGQIHVRTYNEQIRTLRVLTYERISEGIQQSPQRPFLVLTDGIVDGTDPSNTLHISFDEMSHDVKMYTYNVQMMECSALKEGMLIPNEALVSGEYLQGFTTKDITEYEHSLNTSREYTHYEFLFPNGDMQLKMSGQYRLTIYEDGDREKRVAEVDFCVVEPLTRVEGRVRSNTDIELSGRFQQVDFDVLTTAIQVKDPNEIKVLVQQNNRTDNEVWLTKPTFVEMNRLRYINNRALIFEGGNEYHHFDAFSAYYAGSGIDRVYYRNGDYHVSLYADELTNGQYIHQYDSDGRFIINAERTPYPETEGEYMWVYWTLKAEKPRFDGAVYIGGDLFGNELSMRNRMEYDAEGKCYWLAALVKQGGYDYQYWFVPKVPRDQEPSTKVNQSKATLQWTDGTYWQTENEYTVYVYWRPFGARYDRLVGLQILKSTL